MSAHQKKKTNFLIFIASNTPKSCSSMTQPFHLSLSVDSIVMMILNWTVDFGSKTYKFMTWEIQLGFCHSSALIDKPNMCLCWSKNIWNSNFGWLQSGVYEGAIHLEELNILLGRRYGGIIVLSFSMCHSMILIAYSDQLTCFSKVSRILGRKTSGREGREAEADKEALGIRMQGCIGRLSFWLFFWTESKLLALVGLTHGFRKNYVIVHLTSCCIPFNVDLQFVCRCVL